MSWEGVDASIFYCILIHSLAGACIDPSIPPQEFKGITKWILPSEEEAEYVGGIMEALIKVRSCMRVTMRENVWVVV